MKKRFSIEWLSILLISMFSLNTIGHIFLYIDDSSIYNLIPLILYPSCLLTYIVVLIFSKTYHERRFLLIYDDFFEIYGKSIFDSKLICECENKKYVKYGLTNTKEKRYEFLLDNFIINFGLIDIDHNKKLMIIYKVKNAKDDYYEIILEAKNKAKEHYYENNDVKPLEYENVFYKNKRNAYRICERNGKFVVIKYRHYVPVDIHSIKDIIDYKSSWEFLGDSHDDGLDFFETYDKAVEYINYK